MNRVDEKKLAENQHQILNWAKSNLTIILSLLGIIVYLVNKDSLTFDDQSQKNQIIYRLPENFERHKNNTDRHMSADEKRELIESMSLQKTILKKLDKQEESMEKVGMDLQEIKNLTRRKFNN